MSFLVGGYGTQRGSGGSLTPITSIPVENTLYVDSIFGSDATGLPDRFDKPYRTISAAVTASASGDLIHIHAGVHQIFSNIAKDGVNFYAEVGVRLKCFATPFNYDSPAGGTVTTIPSYFMGYGIVESDSPLIIIRVNPDVQFTCEFNEVSITNLSNGMVLSDGITYFNVRNDYVCAGRNFSLRDSGNLVSNIDGIVSCTLVNVFNGNFWTSGSSWAGKADIKATTFLLPSAPATGGNWQHIYIDGSQGCQLNLELEYLVDTAGVAQAFVQIATGGGSTGNTTNIYIKQLSLSGRRLYTVTDNLCNLFMTVDNGIVNGSTQTLGNVYINSSILKSTLTFSNSGGRLNILNSTIDTSEVGGIVAATINSGSSAFMGSILKTDGVAVAVDNIGGVFISDGSQGNKFPTGIVLGDFYVNGVRYENTQTHSAGAAVTILDNRTILFVNPAAPIAMLTITMPAAPLNFQEVKITFGGTITVGAVAPALSIIGNVGQTVLGSALIPAGIAGDGYIFKYEQSTSIWRIF